MRFSTWLLCLCLWRATPSCRSAQAQDLAVHWRAPEGCPSEREVTRGMLGLLPAQAVHGGPRATLDIEVELRADGSFEGHLTVRMARPAPPRVLQGPRCESIAHAAMLIGALTVDAMQTWGADRQYKRPLRNPETPVQPRHSWNTNKRVSSWAMFDLTRHSHHHAQGEVPYQDLRPYPNAPMMINGYLTTIVVALIPPL